MRKLDPKVFFHWFAAHKSFQMHGIIWENYSDRCPVQAVERALSLHYIILPKISYYSLNGPIFSSISMCVCVYKCMGMGTLTYLSWAVNTFDTNDSSHYSMNCCVGWMDGWMDGWMVCLFCLFVLFVSHTRDWIANRDWTGRGDAMAQHTHSNTSPSMHTYVY